MKYFARMKYRMSGYNDYFWKILAYYKQAVSIANVFSLDFF